MVVIVVGETSGFVSRVTIPSAAVVVVRVVVVVYVDVVVTDTVVMVVGPRVVVVDGKASAPISTESSTSYRSFPERAVPQKAEPPILITERGILTEDSFLQ